VLVGLLVLAVVVGCRLLPLGQMFLLCFCLFMILRPSHPPGYGGRLIGLGSCVWVAAVVWVGTPSPVHILLLSGDYARRNVGLPACPSLLEVVLVAVRVRTLVGMAVVALWEGVLLALVLSGCGLLLAAAWPRPL